MTTLYGRREPCKVTNQRSTASAGSTDVSFAESSRDLAASSRRLDRLTWLLAALTAALVGLTIALIVVAA
jgi:hypothetical protein